ncbi:MAG: 6-pyruvoyl-tetrahydropterin synthase-related protein [Elusimicrobiota bacterium]
MSERLKPENRSRLSENLVDAAVLAAIFVFLILRFKPHLLFSNAVATGGDTPSHYYTLLYLKNALLPKLRITGWTQANYAGFPLLEFYFPLPFLLMTFFSLMISIPAAFKLGTIAGVLLLPPCAYASLRAMRAKFPAPIFAAVAVLPFLFMEANSFWGGNISSTLAGEFAYSLGLSLTVLWMGTLERGIRENRGRSANAALLALIGLSHGYTLLFAGVWSLFFLLRRGSFPRRLIYLIQVHGLAILLMGFWLFPLLAHLKWTTAYDFMLPLGDLRSLVPHSLWLEAGLAAYAIFSRRSGEETAQGLTEATDAFSAAALVGILLYAVGPGLGVVDFRFLPFFQIALCLLAALGLARFCRGLRGRLLLPFLALFCGLYLVGANDKNVRAWVDWNYGGFEAKPGWPIFKTINDRLKGSAADPRVIYEHSSQNNMLGTVRGWESLPVFSGRSTLEHAYFQASPTAPFVFYLQSQISKEISCPFPDYGCTSWNLARARAHLALFNVGEFIAVSPEIKSALQKTPGYRLKFSAGPYSVYDVMGRHRYVVPLKNEPVLYTGTRPWKEVSYIWFRTDALKDVFLVFPVGSKARDAAEFPLRVSNLSKLPRRPVPGAAPVKWEKISDDQIEFEPGALNRPYLVKFSYHPDWKVSGADKIYLVSPSFMLVYPNQKKVRLYYSRTFPEYLGLAASLAGLVLLGLLGFGAFAGFEFKIAGIIERRGAWIFTAFWALSAAIFIGAARLSLRQRQSASDTLIARAEQEQKRKGWTKAAEILREVIRDRPVSRFAEQARFDLAIGDYTQGRWAAALREFQGLLAGFPDSMYAPEAWYHMGLCAGSLKNPQEQQRVKALLLRRYPETPWAQYAGAWH